MARYLSASEAASLVLEQTLTESEDESEIEEDPGFPLPHVDEDTGIDDADAEEPHLSLALAPQPLPSSARALSVELDHSSTIESHPLTPNLDVRDDSNNGKQYNRATNNTVNMQL